MVVIELLAVYLVIDVSGWIACALAVVVNDDARVTQLRALVPFVLHGAARSDAEEHSSAFGLCDLKAARALLDVHAQLLWHIMDGRADAISRIRIEADHRDEHDGAYR